LTLGATENRLSGKRGVLKIWSDLARPLAFTARSHQS